MRDEFKMDKENSTPNTQKVFQESSIDEKVVLLSEQDQKFRMSATPFQPKSTNRIPISEP